MRSRSIWPRKGVAKDADRGLRAGARTATTSRSPTTVSATASCFRSRIRAGRIIAFGGRALSPDALAKYMNSPETELFHKGNVLYNFARARKAHGAGTATVIAVEGYMDVIALAQAGFEQCRRAARHRADRKPARTAVAHDAASRCCASTATRPACKAAWRAADLALPAIQPGRTVRFALLPEGKDPDDLVRTEGADAFRQVLAEARPLADLLWMRETAGGVFDTPERRGRTREDAARPDVPHQGRERALPLCAGDARARADLLRPRQAEAAARRRMGAARAAGRASRRRAASSRGRAPEQPHRRVATALPARRWSSAPAASCRCARRRSWSRWSTIPALIDENFEQIEMLDLSHPDLRLLHATVLDAHGA